MRERGVVDDRSEVLRETSVSQFWEGTELKAKEDGIPPLCGALTETEGRANELDEAYCAPSS